MGMTVLMTAQERDRAKVADAYKWNLADVYPSQAAWRAQKEKITAEIPRLRDVPGQARILAGHAGRRARADVAARQGALPPVRLREHAVRRRHARLRCPGHAAGDAAALRELRRPGLVHRAGGAEDRERRRSRSDCCASRGWRRTPSTCATSCAGRRTRCPTPKRRSWRTPAPMAGSANNIYTILANADFPYPTITLADGETVKVDQAGYSELRTSPNRDDRQAAMSAFFGALGGFSRTLGMTMNSNVQKSLFYAKSRKYASRPRGGAQRAQHPGVGLHAAGRRREPPSADVPSLPQAAQADDGADRRPALLRPVCAARRVGRSALHARGGAGTRHRRDGAARQGLHRRAASRLQGSLDRLVSDGRESVGRLLERRRLRRPSRTCCSTTSGSTTTSARWPTSSGTRCRATTRTRRSRTRRRATRPSSRKWRQRSTRRCSSTTC